MDKKTLKILIIDDNLEDRKTLQRYLKANSQQKYIVLEAEEGEEGLAVCQSETPDCIILDYSLPDLDGLEFLMLLRKENDDISIPIIMLTGQGNEFIAVQAMKLGAQDYLVKGKVNEDLLERTIRYAIERRQIKEERLQLENQLHQAQKMRALGTLAGGVAHQFNNLLVPILGFTKRVQSSLDPQSKETDYLERVIQAAKKAKELVSQVMLVSHKSNMERKPLQLVHLVEEELNQLKPLFSASITIREEIKMQIFPIMANAEQMRQMFKSLCLNARDAMPNGGELTITIENVSHYQPFHAHGTKNNNGLLTICQKKTGTFVCLSIQDTGIGISPDNLEHIFEPFFTTKDVGQGVGLGLFMVQGIVEQTEGYIEVDSQIAVERALIPPIASGEEISSLEHDKQFSGGTTFRIYLPASENIL